MKKVNRPTRSCNTFFSCSSHHTQHALLKARAEWFLSSNQTTARVILVGRWDSHLRGVPTCLSTMLSYPFKCRV